MSHYSRLVTLALGAWLAAAPALGGEPVAPGMIDGPTPAPLSPWAMILGADWVVRGVLAILAVASLACWTILLAKLVELSLARRRFRQAEGCLAAASTLRHPFETVDGRGAAAAMINAALQELDASQGLPADGVADRLASRLRRLEAGEQRRLGQGLGALATTGAIGPFVGLFGTVWGIMNSFTGIAARPSATLAAVAPGIAEALLATAIGLIAAIPAVIGYNALGRALAGHRARLADLSAEIERRVSRDLDRALALPRADAARSPARPRLAAE